MPNTRIAGGAATPPSAQRKVRLAAADNLSVLAFVISIFVTGGFFASMFFLVWNNQFAAPPGYLLGAKSKAEEAAICFLVAQDVSSGGAPFGSYPDEAARFWMERLRAMNVQIGAPLTTARQIIAVQRAADRAGATPWLVTAMDLCSRRAVVFGARFDAFN